MISLTISTKFLSSVIFQDALVVIVISTTVWAYSVLSWELLNFVPMLLAFIASGVRYECWKDVVHQILCYCEERRGAEESYLYIFSGFSVMKDPINLLDFMGY